MTLLAVSCYNRYDLSGQSSYIIVSRRIISARLHLTELVNYMHLLDLIYWKCGPVTCTNLNSHLIFRVLKNPTYRSERPLSELANHTFKSL